MLRSIPRRTLGSPSAGAQPARALDRALQAHPERCMV